MVKSTRPSRALRIRRVFAYSGAVVVGLAAIALSVIDLTGHHSVFALVGIWVLAGGAISYLIAKT